MLKNKKISQFEINELSDYKLNLQVTFSHQNMSNLENDTKVLMQVNKSILEIDEKKLDDIIIKLKEIYNKIKV